MPTLNIERIMEDLERIERQLEKENYDTAHLLVKDFIHSLQKVEKALNNWKELAKNPNHKSH